MMAKKRNARKATRRRKETLQQQQVEPSQGINAAHHDLLAYIAQSHGVLYDMAMSHIEKLGFKREQVTYIGCGLLGIYLIFGSAARLLCNLIGFGYPMYASVKAIRTKETDDDTSWLIYWTCFAVLCLFDFFSEGIFKFFPFYYIFKALFLIYLYLPQTRGSIYFYQKYVDPLVTLIDAKLTK